MTAASFVTHLLQRASQPAFRPEQTASARFPVIRPLPDTQQDRDHVRAPGRKLPERMEGGPNNPLGGALYLYVGGKDTHYRIHGTNQQHTIGQALSSRCIRMFNEEVLGFSRPNQYVGDCVVKRPPVLVQKSSGWVLRCASLQRCCAPPFSGWWWPSPCQGWPMIWTRSSTARDCNSSSILARPDVAFRRATSPSQLGCPPHATPRLPSRACRPNRAKTAGEAEASGTRSAIKNVSTTFLYRHFTGADQQW